MSAPEKRPNANQQEAIHWDKGPVLVLAGPGGGKTFVLTERVIRLIEESPNDDFNVLALTFTNKAAAEMRDRVGNRLGSEGQRVEVATFHSFCLGLLRQHGSHIGLRTDFELLTQDADRIAVLRELERKNSVLSHSGLTTEKHSHVLGRLMRSDQLAVAQAMEVADAPSGFQRGQWVSAYVDFLIAQNILDFDALLVCCLRLLRKRPAVAELVRMTYPYVCVDEYQDTNEVQDRLLRLLCPPPGGNLFVVADDDQIIYEWNGASPERLAAMRSDYQMQVVELPESFRCPQEVLALANRLISRNRARLPGKTPLQGESAGGADVVRLRACRDETEEGAWVAHDFRRRGIRAAECAVLARSGRLVGQVHKAFEALGISAFRVERKSDYESPGVRLVAAALRLAASPGDLEKLRRLCKAFFDATGVGVSVEDAATVADLQGGSLLRGFVAAAADGASARPAVHALCASIREQLVERLDYRGFVDGAFSLFESDSSGLAWSEEVRAATLREADRWRELDAEISGASGSDLPLPQMLQELDLRSVTEEPGPEQVRCMTIHQAKGKEFEHVYLVGLAEDQLPSHYAKNGGEHGPQIEEERRNCFVAITRASQTLTLTYARSYFGWEKSPSRFVAEMELVAPTSPVGVRQ